MYTQYLFAFIVCVCVCVRVLFCHSRPDENRIKYLAVCEMMMANEIDTMIKYIVMSLMNSNEASTISSYILHR